MKKLTPSLEELHDPEKFQMLASVNHDSIKDFVLSQVIKDKIFIPVYMVYQTLLFLSGLFFLTRSLVLFVKGNGVYFLVTVASLIFSFTLLVAIHELLHGLALKLAGARKISFDGDLKKFIFYAGADKFVMGRIPFLFVAFTPLVVMQVIAIAGIIVLFSSPLVYFFLIMMTIHSFFCSGDVALVSIFYQFPGKQIFTYDDISQKKSYYFLQTGQ